MQRKTVSEVMSRNVSTLKTQNTLLDSYNLMNKKRISSIPIVENNKVIGIITRGDLRRYGSQDLSNIKIKQAMSKGPYSVTSLTSTYEAKRLMDQKRIGSLVVIDDGKLKGIITRSDLRGMTSVSQVPYFHPHRAIPFFKYLFIIGIFVFIIWLMVHPLPSTIQVEQPEAKQTVVEPQQPSAPSTVENEPIIDFSSLSSVSKLYLSKDVGDALNEAFASNSVEFIYCMYAEKYKDSYLINRLYKPKTGYASERVVMPEEDCSPDSVGKIHSHPNGNCIPSDPTSNPLDISNDVDNLIKERYPLEGIMCDPDKIAIYTKNSLTKSISLFLISNDQIIQDLTLDTPCRGDRFCQGKCWDPDGCPPHRIWRCTSNGGLCDYEPGYCTEGLHWCNDRCWEGCTEPHRIWKCTSEGGRCDLEPGYCEPGSHWCNNRCWQGCSSGTWTCTAQGGMCMS